MKKVLIFGGTGFIGRSLAFHLKKNGIEPILISRNKPDSIIDFKFKKWDSLSVGEWKETLDNSMAVVNLAGKTVDCIKSPDNCDLILKSRLNSTITIGKAFRQVKNPPKTWIQMSTAHIYGDPPTELCTEDSEQGYGLAPYVGKAWEKAFLNSKPDNVRGVILRTSFVIGKNGGALRSLKNIVSLGFGGTVGKGNQGMSWIHEFDMNEIIYQSIIDVKYKGVYIASAPNPVSNKEFMKTLRNKMRMPFGFPAPEMVVRLGAKLVFRTDPELALYGRYVKSVNLELNGFKFKYPYLSVALSHLLNKTKENNT